MDEARDEGEDGGGEWEMTGVSTERICFIVKGKPMSCSGYD